MSASYGYFNRYEQLTSCRVASASNLTVSYYNGPNNNGIGATLTNAGSQAALSIDSITLNINDRVLVSAQTTGLQNGIYVVQALGSSSSNWVMVRAQDFQSGAQLATGMFCPIEAGAIGAGAFYTLVEPLPTSIGVSNVVFQGHGATSDVSFVGTPVVNNLPVVVDLFGNIGDSGIASNEVLQSSFASPDVNANIVIATTGSLTNTQIIAGSALFTPTGSKTYRIVSLILNVTTSFSGGSNNSALIIDIGSTDIITATNTAIKATAQSYQLGQSGFTWTGANANITAANPLKLKADASSDYSGGLATIQYSLVRTA